MSNSDAPAGPRACAAIATTMIGHFTTRLEVEAARHGGLNADDVRRLAEAFLADEFSRFDATFRRSYDTCTATREVGRWESTRTRPFDRVLMKAFAHLFPARQGDDGGQGLLSRRVIPGFNLAIDKMIGPALYEQCQVKSLAIVQRHRTAAGTPDWQAVHADPQTHALTNDVLMVVAHYFGNFERRRDWFLGLVNSHLAKVAPDAADAHWQLSEHGFAELMRALFAELRATLATAPAALRRRYGDHTVDTVEAFLDRLDRG